MAEWLGHLLGSLPGWLFLPALIILIVVVVVGALIFAPAGFGIASDALLRSKKLDLGESKKNGKK